MHPTSPPTANMPKNAVLLSCGSFSPVTAMHVAMLERARSALEERGFRVIRAYLSPVHDGYRKRGLAPSSDRIRMLQLATDELPWLVVDAWEAQQSAASPSYVVAEHISSLVPDAAVIFVCGADLVHSMQEPSKWPPENVHRLLDVVQICAMRREGSDDPPESLRNRDGKMHQLFFVDTPALPGSSTDVRKLVSEGKAIGHLVHPDVAAYIRRQKLFKMERRTG